MPFPPLISLLVALLLLTLLWWAFTKIARALNAPEPILTIGVVLIVVMAVLYLLSALRLVPASVPRLL